MKQIIYVIIYLLYPTKIKKKKLKPNSSIYYEILVFIHYMENVLA